MVMKSSIIWVFFAILVSFGILVSIYYGLNRSKNPQPLSVGNFAAPLTYLSEELEQKPQTFTIVFAGDIMLDRNIRVKAEKQGYNSLLGPHLQSLLKNAAYVVANVEGPITTNPSASVGSEPGSSRNFIFTFAPESTTFLKDNNITIVNLGNNHILNFSDEGLAQTYAFLKQANINYFGYTGTAFSTESTTYVLEKNGFTIGFVNYNQFITGGESKALSDIQVIRPKVDYVVLYTHWGNEYQQENKAVVDLAHAFIDAGVDVIIGSHPHIINGHEVYKGKDIFYSLGNFVFDQYFDEEVKKGMLVIATMDPEKKTVTFNTQTVSITPTSGTELAQ